MERKRVAGRFAAEDKGGVTKKRTTAAPQPVAEALPEAASQKPKTRGRNLVRLLVDRLKKHASAA
ncbi:MAG TPA: hypothetical protein VGU67_01770 [Edaphobacter sp.]|nr:hypothetical protein [Edaphobacter sp.]